MPRSSPYVIILTDQERAHLEATARRYTSPYRDVLRARIVLYAAEGLRNDEIAARLDTPRQIVSNGATLLHPTSGRTGRCSPGRTATGFSPQKW
jgi:hypothetical protein